jgi:hypothetical protein
MGVIGFPPTLGPGTYKVVVNDNNGNPATVLDAGKDFTIDVEWTIDPVTAGLLAGQWEVSAYVESIGPGVEDLIGQSVEPVNGGTNYSTTINVLAAAGKLPNNPAPPQSSVYRLATVLTHRNQFNKISELAGFDETVLQIA